MRKVFIANEKKKAQQVEDARQALALAKQLAEEADEKWSKAKAASDKDQVVGQSIIRNTQILFLIMFTLCQILCDHSM